MYFAAVFSEQDINYRYNWTCCWYKPRG